MDLDKRSIDQTRDLEVGGNINVKWSRTFLELDRTIMEIAYRTKSIHRQLGPLVPFLGKFEGQMMGPQVPQFSRTIGPRCHQRSELLERFHSYRNKELLDIV